jgi:hypothetical protein
VLPQAIERNLFDELTLYDTNINGQPRRVLSVLDRKVTVHDRALWRDFLVKGEQAPGGFGFEAGATYAEDVVTPRLTSLNAQRQETARRFAEKGRAARASTAPGGAAIDEQIAAGREYVEARDAWRAVARETVPEPWVDASTYDGAVAALSDRGITSNVALRGEDARLEWINPKSRQLGLGTPLPQRERLETLNRLGRVMTDMRIRYPAVREVAFEDLFLSSNNRSLYMANNRRDMGRRLGLRVTSPQKWEKAGAEVRSAEAYFAKKGRAFTYGAEWEDAVRHEIGHGVLMRTPEIEVQIRKSWRAMRDEAPFRSTAGELSDYGVSGGEDEAIAEVVSIVTRSDYGTSRLPERFGLSKQGNRLHPVLEDWGQRLLAGLIP